MTQGLQSFYQSKVITKSFSRRFFEFSFGTIIAQALSLLLMPVVSRLYSPSEMGDYAIFVSLSTILSIVVNLRLDVPIVLASTEREAQGLLVLGQASALILSTTLFFAFLVARQFGFQSISTALGLMIAISIFASASVQSFANFYNRHQWYKKLALRNAGERFLVLGVGLVFGWLALTSVGLPLAQTLGFVASVIFFFVAGRISWPHFTFVELKTIFGRYSDFPRQNLLSAVLNVSSVYGAPLLFAAFFTKADLGSLNLATRLFDAPIYLIGYTFHSIYYRHVVDLGPAQRLRLFWRSLKLLAVAGTIPFLIVSLKGEWIFTHFFGAQWQLSGRLAFWLAPYTLLRLGFVSQMALLLVYRRLALDLGINLTQVIGQALGFFVGFLWYGSVEAAVAGICIAGGCVHLLSLMLIYGMLKRETQI